MAGGVRMRSERQIFHDWLNARPCGTGVGAKLYGPAPGRMFNNCKALDMSKEPPIVKAALGDKVPTHAQHARRAQEIIVFDSACGAY